MSEELHRIWGLDTTAAPAPLASWSMKCIAGGRNHGCVVSRSVRIPGRFPRGAGSTAREQLARVESERGWLLSTDQRISQGRRLRPDYRAAWYQKVGAG